MAAPVYIAIMGVTGAGKSSFISLLCDSKIEIGHNLESCTSEVGVYPCNLFPGRTIYFIDTPGFDDSNRRDTEVLRELASYLSKSYSNNLKLNGIMYFHRISDNKMQGSAKKNLVMFKKLCGSDALKNVILITSMWDRVAKEEGIKRETELLDTPEFWGFMKSKGSKAYRHNNSVESAEETLRHFLPDIGSKITLDIQQEMVVDNLTVDQTGAGKQLEIELEKERERFKAELKEITEQLLEAMRKRDQESESTMREMQKEYEEKLEQLGRDQLELQSTLDKSYQERYNWLESQMTAHQATMLEREQRKHLAEIEQLKTEHRTQLDASTNSLRTEIDKLKQEQQQRQQQQQQRQQEQQQPPPPPPPRSRPDPPFPSRRHQSERPYHGYVVEQPTWRSSDGGAVCFSPNGLLTYSSTLSSRIKTIDATTLEEVLSTEANGSYIARLQYSPSGKILVSSASDGTIRLWNATDHTPLDTIYGPAKRMSQIAFTPDGQCLVSSSSSNDNSKLFLQVYNVQTNTLDRTLWQAGRLLSSILALAISPRGTLLAVGTSNGITHLHDLKSSEEGRSVLFNKFFGGTVRAVTFLSDQRLASFDSMLHKIFIWDTRGGRWPLDIPLLFLSGEEVVTATFSIDNRLLAVGLYKDVVVCTIPDGAFWQRIKAATKGGRIFQLAISHDNKLLAVTSDDGSVTLHQLKPPPSPG